MPPAADPYAADPYVVLGIAADATPGAIEKAYRKLAKKWHPDKNLGNEDVATERFKEIAHAHEVLSIPSNRKYFDKYGTSERQDDGDAPIPPYEEWIKQFPGPELGEYDDTVYASDGSEDYDPTKESSDSSGSSGSSDSDSGDGDGELRSKRGAPARSPAPVRLPAPSPHI